MKYIFLSIILNIVLSIHVHARTTGRAGSLVSILSGVREECEVVPDSFFPRVRTLMAEVAAQEDPAARAVYSATLAHLLMQNTQRAAASSRDTSSPTDSIEEWSEREYEQYAASMYRNALCDMDILYGTPTCDWLPLVLRGRDEKVFGSSMLHVVWQAMAADFPPYRRTDYDLPFYADIMAFYASRSKREAELRMSLDSLETVEDRVVRRKGYEVLVRQYEDIPSCDMAYDALAGLTDDKAGKVALLRKALDMYPRSVALRNALSTALRPILNYQMPLLCYPDKEYDIPLTIANMKGMTQTIYRMPDDFAINYRSDTSVVRQVRMKGKVLRRDKVAFPLHPVEEVWHDTLRWKAPDLGVYALVTEGKPGAKVEDALPEVHVFYVSRLGISFHDLPKGKTQIIVTDAMSGQPVPGVQIHLSKTKPNGELVPTETLTTDDSGKALYEGTSRGVMFVSASKGEDRAWKSVGRKNRIFAPYATRGSQGKEYVVQVFTDRAVYRPGQKVYVGALAYSVQGDDASVLEGRDYTLTFLDAKRTELARHFLKTDGFGMLSDSLQIPKDAAPGRYIVRVGTGSTSVRVEEYRRPTFEVRMDEPPSVSLPADSITLTGSAATFSGLPLADVRVAGKATFSSTPWLRDIVVSSVLIDTVRTDAGGRFAVRIPLKEGQRAMRQYGTRMTVCVDVLSSTGETQQGEVSVCLSTKSFVLRGEIPSVQDREHPRPWRLSLYSGTGCLMEEDITCNLLRDGRTVHTFSFPSGKEVVPECISSLPSGAYALRAEYASGSDTARYEAGLEIFSMSDTKLGSKQELRLYTQCDTFGIGRPATVQIGTTLPRAWIYLTMASADRVVKDTLMCLADTAFTWPIPYREEYGDGLSVSASVMHEGELHAASLSLVKQSPDKRLRMRWETFRDKSRPGQAEEWKLSLRMPDGTPALANVLLSMYDASLDDIVRHSLRLYTPCRRYVPYMRHYGGSFFDTDSWHWNLDLPVKLIAGRGATFSVFDGGFFSFLGDMAFGGDFRGRIAGLELSEGMQGSRKMLAASDMKVMSLSGVATEGAAMSNVVEDDEAADISPLGRKAYENGNGKAKDDGLVRGTHADAFSELAFFRPVLRTGADGNLAISFTMPESLTRWHLKGFAHTKDVYACGIDEAVEVSKELMAEMYLPRFLRKGDKASFTASVRNNSSQRQAGTATCLMMDASTEAVLQRWQMTFDLAAGADTIFTLLLYDVAQETSELLLRWKASAEDFADGEQRSIPVLSDTETVTETKAFSLSNPGTTRIDLTRLYASNHPLATGRRMTVEYTTRPLWMALRSLPHLYSPASNDVLSLTAAYYATTQARNILCMASVQASDASLVSSLADSLSYGDALTLDNRMSLLSRLSARQRTDGSFAWYPGMRGNEYVTREVATQLARLRACSPNADEASVVADRVLASALTYLSKQFRRTCEDVRKDKSEVPWSALSYLYLLHRSGMQPETDISKDADYLVGRLADQAAKTSSPEEDAMAAIVLNAHGRQKDAIDRMDKVCRLVSQKDGCYLAYPSGNGISIDRKLQAHVQVMEAVCEVMPDSTHIINGLTEWLLQQKRTQQWDDPVRTVNAVHALVKQDGKSLADASSDVLRLRDSGVTRRLPVPDGAMGCVCDSAKVDAPSLLTIEKRSSSLSWGAVFATYEMPMDSVRAHWQGFRIRRDIPAGAARVGDRLHVRYTVTADRDYDFVSLRTTRPAATEPASKVSGYASQGTIGYYMEVRDTGCEYYFDSMPRGTYVIEEDWIAERTGEYVTGSASIRCVYAPEYQSNMSGARLVVE